MAGISSHYKSVWLSLAQLVSIGQLHTICERHTLHDSACIHFHGNNMEPWCHTLPWNSIRDIRDVMVMSYTSQCFILHVGTFCRTYTWRVHIFDIGCATDHTLLGFPSTHYRFHVCKHGMQSLCTRISDYLSWYAHVRCMTLTLIAVNSIHTSLIMYHVVNKHNKIWCQTTRSGKIVLWC